MGRVTPEPNGATRIGKSFVGFNVKRVAAGCVGSYCFHMMECRRENLPMEHLDTSSKKYVDLQAHLIRTEKRLLKERGFICHVYLSKHRAKQTNMNEMWLKSIAIAKFGKIKGGKGKFGCKRKLEKYCEPTNG
ncbi:hypothetical protein F511_27908 [Dorcoceras hygrometricum]|uniref:Uncharacterized protein n=1 Tax=Dorcoceras hygrometricum TaxID=472368 RepID=A0A2Z7BTH7_9LAMI|nr:hypothetical protein F511_27908 [Dorcoceras hygrometricum]